ncbi:interactor of constitutive active ROPs 4-like [Diospyros lotus]|uniref:interactor of constitutive active ROPs 4-like n=1 Tax=Diospyros lotus TaxID=55363 RepID=UPI0022522AE3|nr:interactor of constitutive active ROPs 4-like [Diospyros lotus]
MSTRRAKEEEMAWRLSELREQLEASKANEMQLKGKLEAEMKKLRVQVEQWRKTIDVVATVLTGGLEMNGRWISERCESMNKHYGNMFKPSTGGYTGFVGSPSLGDDTNYGFGSGKKKSYGIRMFRDLWKKRGQK